MWARLADEAPRFFTYYNGIFLLQAMGATLLLSLGGCLAGSFFGLLLVLLRKTKGALFLVPRALAWGFVEFFRRVPPLVVLLLAFFASNLVKMDVSLFLVALVALTFVATAFMAEIIRAGIEGVHPNQWDSAATMNFGYLRTMLTIILPQAWKIILPPAFSFFLLFVKDTAFASQLGTLELTYAGKVLTSRGFTAVLSYGSILVLYFALSYPLARFGAWLEDRLAPSGNH